MTQEKIRVKRKEIEDKIKELYNSIGHLENMLLELQHNFCNHPNIKNVVSGVDFSDAYYCPDCGKKEYV